MKLHLAPIQGITNKAYRNKFNELFQGIDIYYTPFIVTTEKLKNFDHHFKDILPKDEAINLVPQLLSNSPHDFTAYAKKIKSLGYSEINWNIGCPFPIVVKKHRGSGLMPYPQWIKEILDEFFKENICDLSVKMRLGLNDVSEGLKLIELFNEYPIKTIIIHARTGIQQYEGKVSYDDFELLYGRSRHKIIYNGDIITKEDYDNFRTRFPNIDEIMLGRGALYNPFLPQQIKNPNDSIEKPLSKLRALHDAVLEDYKVHMTNEIHLCHKMKEFWRYTGVFLDPSTLYIDKIHQTQNLQEYNYSVNEIFKQYHL
ncbi:MAG: tRNA-dihydrouridine synthase family protein [Clostridia bacterium]|nr:tRNA-dihydrouridine synthase family protein [Clostridia bacterium]